MVVVVDAVEVVGVGFALIVCRCFVDEVFADAESIKVKEDYFMWSISCSIFGIRIHTFFFS